ncbi:N-6 DNA methylase [Patescibacteria group bacterium AH-259-L07]|nr:N-6 DNA methylase [Patescibacteria group bacterium AH-259-L07]
MDNLIKKYSIEEIEQALIQAFIDNKEIKIKKNLLLLDIINRKSRNINEIKNLIKMPESFDDLVRGFELLIPDNDKKLNGAFFTPDFITNFMSDELISSPNDKICDPSCGCGAFLIASCEYIKNKFNKKIKDIIKDNIYGVDILDYGTRRCKILLSLLAAINGEDEKNYSFNIYTEDSLASKWEHLFPSVFKNGGFDIIIGNPPYVKYQDLPQELRKGLYENWTTLKKGTYNLYFAFFELGLSIMKNTGRLAYIVPNNYFTSLAGICLRSYLQNNRFIERIIDFNHLKIFKVQTYTCITFLSKRERKNFLYEKIESPASLANLKNLNYSPIEYTDLNIKKWRLLRREDRLNIKKIEKQPNKLGDMTDIRVGIATCKDNVYFIEGKSLEKGYYKKIYKDKVYLIEREIVKPIDKISDFKDQKNLAKNSRMIIFPYIIKNSTAKIIPEKKLKQKFPKCYEYLLAAKDELSIRDKGNGQYPVWYAYARTQGLSIRGKKLLTPTFSDKPRFLLENNEESLFCNGYGIYEKKVGQLGLDQKIKLNILQKILNSKIMDYYISRTSFTIEGAYPCYQKNFIELFGIPIFTEQELGYLEAEKMMDRIDKFLIKKYKLSLQS